MKEVLIDDVIGYDWWSDSGVTAKGVQKQLEGLENGEDIKIVINSPGGSVYEGVVIFNMIRDYAKTHPVSVRINCMAMSMASYIALAARTVDSTAKITVSENSVLMIHNPWGVAVGDYREMKKDADYFEKLAALYGSVHSAVSKKSEKEIRAAMDDETYYVGKEIEEAGFANDFEIIAQAENINNDRDVLVASAHFEIQRSQDKAREAKAKDPAAYRGDIEKAVALFTPAPKPPAAESAETGGKNNNSGGLMTIEELKAQNKTLYDAVFALGEEAGLDKERARVNAHILLGEKSGSLELAAKHIKAGVSSGDETAQAEYFAAKMDKAHIDAREKDDPGAINTSGGSGGADDDAKQEAAFNNGLKGLDVGGKPCRE